MPRENSPQIALANGEMSVDLSPGKIQLPVVPLPQQCIDWIHQGRKAMYQKILDEDFGSIRFFPQHLPVVVTYSAGKRFPFNCGNKGVGFIPKDEFLQESIELFEETHQRTRNRPWRESLKERVRAVASFYLDQDKIDHRAMATLEIFERTTFENLKATPLASLLFTGHLPDYTSFQLNCAVEVVGEDDPRHTFIKLSRTMFEYDNFHITQPQFQYAYIFWISEVADKTPFRVKENPARTQLKEVQGDMRWHESATEAVGRAPAMIQDYIRESVERFARERGFTEITPDVLQEARDNMM